MKGNIGNMMKQAQQLQANMQRAQAEIAALEVTGEAGGGMAKVTMTGRHEVRRVSLDPSIVSADDTATGCPRCSESANGAHASACTPTTSCRPSSAPSGTG